MSVPKCIVKSSDMAEGMENDAINYAVDGLDKFNTEKEVAQYLRKAFVDKYHGVWHCIVGRNFGSYVTNEAKHYIYFYQGQIAVCLFKTN